MIIEELIRKGARYNRTIRFRYSKSRNALCASSPLEATNRSHSFSRTGATISTFNDSLSSIWTFNHQHIDKFFASGSKREEYTVKDAEAALGFTRNIQVHLGQAY